MAEDYNRKGNKFFDEGQYEKAKEFYSKAIQMSPKTAMYYFNRANAHYYSDNYEEALEDCNSAVDINPNLASAYGLRGGVCFVLKKLDIAIQDCNRAFALDPKNDEALFNRGMCYTFTGQYAKAEKDFRDVMNIEPVKKKNAFAWLAKVYYFKGDFDKAFEAANQHVEMGGDSGGAFFVRGCVYLERRKLREAKNDFDTYVRLSPKIKRWYHVTDQELAQKLQELAEIGKSATATTPNKPSAASPGPSHADNFSGDWKVGDSLLIDATTRTVLLSQNDPLYSQITKELSKVPGYKIKSIEIVNNSGQMRLFHGCIEKVEMREKMKEFQPELDKESSPAERKQILKQIETLASKVKHNRKARIVRAWHGTSFQLAKSIIDVGFANLAKLDAGWFGKGIYFSSFPEYSFRYSKGDMCLMLCYVILANPYPLVVDDAPSPNKLVHLGKANYKHYGCHYVPVVQYGTMDYRPPPTGKSGVFDEIVIFQEEHILPKFIVHLVPNERINSEPSTSSSSSRPSEWEVDDVVTWMRGLKLSQDYSNLVKSNHVNGLALESMKDKDDWKELGVTVFGDVRALTTAVTKLFTSN